MKKPTPLYLFVVLIALGIVGFSFSIILIGFDFGNIGFILLIFVILGIVSFFMVVAKGLNTSQFEERLKIRKECPSCHAEIDANSDYCPKCGVNLNGQIECDYCGHLNPFDAESCENCNANLK